MPQPDFNDSFKEFRKESKAYTEALKCFRADESYKETATRPASRRALDATFEVVFETLVIFGTIAPKQAGIVMSQSPDKQIHDFHSGAVRREFRAATAKSTGISPLLIKFGVSCASMVLTRPKIAERLEGEAQNLLAASEPAPPPINRRSPRS